ncbi:hypothetical protein QE429_000902 [Bacillus sp. SORGH_AS 510]|uniref:hypothetical protein n=1 Tax=Bacillus sp. SORGH_AS_0510 TaxID=3041771 RepID=UPI00278B7314|nr:hypothetical protein [Bacillus sp. SORGH_AS_0510]MDQ1144075.1 hypothetical protein [Bacillus sp. SORGH_AS_0510]
MKRLVLLSVCSLFFLTAMAKQQEVVPFLQPVTKELTQSTKVPVLLPTYWSKPTSKSKRYLTCYTHAYENGYQIDFLTMDKPYRPNDPALFHPRESWKIGDLYGNVGTVTSVVRPENFVFYKNKDGFELWIEPRIRSMVHGTDGKWTLLFDGDHGEEPYKQADELLKQMKKVHWLKNKDIIEGEIFVRGTRQAARVNFVWETSDGFVYSFFYNGSIKDAVKIVDSMQLMR